MLRRAKAILKSNFFTALYDKGYHHTRSEFKIAHELGIKTLVAISGIGRASQAPNPKYNVEHFNPLYAIKNLLHLVATVNTTASLRFLISP